MICVLIERHIATTLEAAYEVQAKNILQAAVHAPGFISGEALKDINDANHRYIWSKWRTIQEWQAWENSTLRKDMMMEMNSLLDKEESIRILVHS